MPRYDMQCRDCKRETEVICLMLERNKQHCGHCHGKMSVLISPTHVQVWQPSWYWLSSKEKVLIRSKRQLFEECRKRDKVAVCQDQAWKEPQHEPTGGLKRAAEVFK